VNKKVDTAETCSLPDRVYVANCFYKPSSLDILDCHTFAGLMLRLLAIWLLRLLAIWLLRLLAIWLLVDACNATLMSHLGQT